MLPWPPRHARAAPALRHLAGAAIAAAAAALPGAAGLPMAPEGQPFLLVLAIALAAFRLGRAPAITASLVAIAAGTWLLPAGDGGGGALVALLPLPMIALGMTGVAESCKGVFSILAMVDARRAAARGVVPASAPADRGQPGAAG